MAAEMPEVPKVSQFLEPLTRPEAEFEARVEEATRMTPPPGPMSTLSRVAESVEAAKPPTPPAVGGSSPSFPRLPPIGGGRESPTKVSRPAPTKRRTPSESVEERRVEEPVH